MLVANQELLAQLHDLLTRHGNLILHVRDEQILVQLVNVGDGFEVPVFLPVLLGDLLRLTVTLSSALWLLVVLAQIERSNRIIGLPGRVAQRVFKVLILGSDSLNTRLGVTFVACRNYLVLFLLEYVSQVLP